MASARDRFRQSITFAVLTGRDAYGKPTLGSQSTAAARVQPSRKIVKDVNGNDAATTHKVYTAAAITVFHRVWLPGSSTGDFNQARKPIAVDEEVDGAGVTQFRTVWF
jgi:hypothetical protein